MALTKAQKADPVRVEHIRFNLSRPQVWRDVWRNRDRVCRFVGSCVVCSTRTYAFDDGENDPRGALGDHAASPMDPADFERTVAAEEVPVCFPCANDYDRYQIAVRIAERRWDGAELRARSDDWSAAND